MAYLFRWPTLDGVGQREIEWKRGMEEAMPLLDVYLRSSRLMAESTALMGARAILLSSPTP